MFEQMTSKEYQYRCAAKRSKYGNKKITAYGQTFDSFKEYERWVVLKFLEKVGEIKGLQRQVEFELIPKGPGVRRTIYKADFVYDELELDKTWTHRVEDVKSPATRRDPVYRLKKKLMRAKFGIIIQEI